MKIVTAKPRKKPKALSFGQMLPQKGFVLRVEDETFDIRQVIAASRADVYLLREWYRLNYTQDTGLKRELLPLLERLRALTFERLELAYTRLNLIFRKHLPDYTSMGDRYLFKKLTTSYHRMGSQHVWAGPFELDQYYETAHGGPTNLEVDGLCHRQETKSKKDCLRDEYLSEIIGIRIFRPENTPHARTIAIFSELGSKPTMASRSIKRIRVRKFIETLATAEHNPIIKKLGKNANLRPQHVLCDLLEVDTITLEEGREIIWRWKKKYIEADQQRWLPRQ